MATTFKSLEAYKLDNVRVTDHELGRGSYAVVLELNYKGLKCAGKKIHDLLLTVEDENDSQDNRSIIVRFEKECQLLSQVRHPNIVQFLGVHFQDNMQSPFLVMEFLPMNLASCIKKYHEIPTEIGYSILFDTALGLNYLHSQLTPIVHRDLSSNNVLLTPNMSAKISDLGVAKILNLTPQQISRMTRNPGTLAYMPPEVMVADPKYDISVDEFSYGVLMIHVLSGKWPEPQIGQIIIKDGQMVPVSEAQRREKFLTMIGNDHPLMELILKCINNDPQKRANTREIVQQLEELVMKTPKKFTNRLTILQQIEANEEAIRHEELEVEEQVTRQIEAIEQQLQESNSSEQEMKLTYIKDLQKLQIELESLVQLNTELSASKETYLMKVQRQKELFTSLMKSIKQFENNIKDLSDNQLEEKGQKVELRSQSTASVRKARAISTPGCFEPNYAEIRPKRYSDDLSRNFDKHSRTTSEVKQRIKSAGSNDSRGRSGTLRRVGKTFGKVLGHLVPRQQPKLSEGNTTKTSLPQKPLYVGKFNYEAQNDDELSFKKGDIMMITSKEGDWWYAHFLDSAQEGLIPSNYVAEHKSLAAEEWFFGKLEHDRVKQLLMQCENSIGSYAVCESTSTPKSYTLCIRTTDRVVTHPIQKQKGKGFFVTANSSFSSIQELIESYHQEAGELGIKLTRPCLIPVQHNQIDRKKLKLLKKLSSGQFSETWQGLLRGKHIIAKMSPKEKKEDSHKNILHEANIMQKFVHNNIVSLLGVCSGEEPHYIIMEYMANGNLHEYLSSGDGKLLEEQQIITMAAQVASGMVQLELSKCIHRDLAARSILVGENNVCKIGHFHYAQDDSHGYDFSITPAVKWTAPEVLSAADFSTKSDVWSFGVVIFEMITHGQAPYADMTNEEVTYKVVNENYRIPYPDKCPERLYSMMLQCWKADPISRPTFETLQWQLEDFYTLTDDYLYGYSEA